MTRGQGWALMVVLSLVMWAGLWELCSRYGLRGLAAWLLVIFLAALGLARGT